MGLSIAIILLIGYGGVVAWAIIAERLHPYIGGFLLAANIIAFLCYAIDKAAAPKARRRISEAMLHTLELLGGWPSALLAQQIFRHKTRKLSFQVTFYVVALINTVILIYLIFPRLFQL